MGTKLTLEELKEEIARLVPDGVRSRRNILTMFADPDKTQALISCLAEPYRGKVDYVCAPESLGLIVGALLARELGVGFVAVRRNRLFPAPDQDLLTASYIDHRDQVTTLSTSRKLMKEGGRVLLADDWVETAATVHSCTNLIEECGCKMIGVAAIGAEYNSAARDMIDAGIVHCIQLDK